MSVVFSGAALVVLATCRAVVPEWLPAPKGVLKDPSGYVVDHYRLVLRAFVAQIGIASSFALVLGLIRYPQRLSFEHDALWNVIRRSQRRPNIPIIDLKTSDGTCLKGKLWVWDQTGPISDRFIALRAPIYLQRGSEPREELPAGWNRTLVPLSEITEMHFGFAQRGPDDEDDAVSESQRFTDWREWLRMRPKVLG
jgi:hypothetical protein